MHRPSSSPKKNATLQSSAVEVTASEIRFVIVLNCLALHSVKSHPGVFHVSCFFNQGVQLKHSCNMVRCNIIAVWRLKLLMSIGAMNGESFSQLVGSMLWL